MCLVTFIKDGHPDYPLILVANRDELYDRPAAAIHRWVDHPNVTAGVDLKASGTWLGFTDCGRFIAVLNHPFVDWTPTLNPPRSRGQLLKDYLTSDFTIDTFEKYLEENRTKYNGFHLLYGTFDDLRYYSNVENTFYTFKNGFYCLANTKDDMSQNRMERSEELLQQYLDKHSGEIKLEELTSILADKKVASKLENYPKELTPELALNNSSIFIQGEEFGTVGTTAILIDKEGNIQVREVKYDQNGITEVTEKQQHLLYE